MKQSLKFHRGMTLVEVLVGTAIFVIISLAVYNSYVIVYDTMDGSKFKIDGIDLATEQIELVRNLPYDEVGIVGGLPSGVLTYNQNFTRDNVVFNVTTTVRNYDDPFDGLFPTDTSPNDSKIVQVEVDCALCKNYNPVILMTRVAPKNLETAASNGALIIKAFDANGNPLPQAKVKIVGTLATSTVTINDVTDNTGTLEEVDMPPGQNIYQISVTKPGYTTDQTYATSSQNQNPTKPNATVLVQQVTTESFIVDKVSTMNVSTEDENCNAVPNVAFSMNGAKTIGNNPVIYKYSQNLNSGSSGSMTLPNMEWDSYSITLNDPSYELIGANPLIPIALSPNATQNVQLIVEPKNPDTLLATVEDSSSGLPISGAQVELLSGSTVDATRYTGQGFFSQTDWSGGSGQATSTNPTKYFSSDGNVVVNAPVGGLTLRQSLGQYQTDGSLISSSFDTSGASNFGNIIWSPLDQPTSTGASAVRFQIATNNDGATWNFTGPDGTAGTYYDTTDTNISAVNNGNRYLRYEVFLHTDNTNYTPNVADIAFTFTSSCEPPGQVSFSGLTAGSYSLQISDTGYQTQTIPIIVGSAWQSQTISLTPQ